MGPRLYRPLVDHRGGSPMEEAQTPAQPELAFVSRIGKDAQTHPDRQRHS